MATSFVTLVSRPTDLLFLRLEFSNVTVTPGAAGGPADVAGGPGATLVVHFQPQHIAEQAYYEGAPGEPAPGANEPPDSPGFVRARLSGSSRLAFAIPGGTTMPLTLEGVLDALPTLPQLVAPVARYQLPGCAPLATLLAPSAPVIAPPQPNESALELPYRLVLSPDQMATWQHAATPVTRDGWTELWHTRLGSRRASGDPRVRAIWSPDFAATQLQPHSNSPFRMSLDARDRNELVHLTSNYHISGFVPDPVETERLMLSTLGAWLRVQGDWELAGQGPGTSALTVEQWRHDAGMGRDHYVRVVYAGFLMPFGHRASLVKVTERRFTLVDEPGPGYVSHLYQRMFLIVRQPTRQFSHRHTPLRQVTIKSRVTPPLLDPNQSQVAGQGMEAFWPRIWVPGGTAADYRFHLSATDWEGQTVEFTAPLLFISLNADKTQAAAVTAAFNAEAVSSPRRRYPLHGQPVAFAPPATPQDTTLRCADLSFQAEHQPGEPQGRPHFRPVMQQAQSEIPAVKNATGSSAPSTIEWEPSYLLAQGNEIGNAARVFTRLIGTTPLSFGSTEKVGGLVAPDLSISGISRALGPVGGPVQAMVDGNFNPKDIFPSIKLLGGIDLKEIVKDLVFSNAANVANKLPGLVTTREGDLIRTRYTWSLTRDELVNTGLFVPGSNASFVLEATVEKKLDGSPPTSVVTGTLSDFSVVLLPGDGLKLVSLAFQSVSFTAIPGKKVDTAVQFGGVGFHGILEFVNRLREFIPLDGFNDPPSLELVPPPNQGVKVGFSLGIPTIGIGIMTMQNITLAAGFYLPFGDKPMNFRFAFCERQQPFILTVMLFGGGGFFGIEIGPKGVVLIEAALEFGASAAINLGVAAGSVSIMAGFYFKKAGADFSLTGYFRACGSLSVLGIITVSLEFYLGLTYASKSMSPHGGKLWGQAKLTVKVEILFFSTSVSISMEREFAGSDPTFCDMMALPDWQTYCDAFGDYP